MNWSIFRRPVGLVRTSPLTELGQKTGIDFSHDIGVLAERIAEHEESPEAERSEISTGTSFSSPAPVVTESDVLQMFSTLKGEPTVGGPDRV